MKLKPQRRLNDRNQFDWNYPHRLNLVQESMNKRKVPGGSPKKPTFDKVLPSITQWIQDQPTGIKRLAPLTLQKDHLPILR